jgi:hypothetical protein
MPWTPEGFTADYAEGTPTADPRFTYTGEGQNTQLAPDWWKQDPQMVEAATNYAKTQGLDVANFSSWTPEQQNALNNSLVDVYYGIHGNPDSGVFGMGGVLGLGDIGKMIMGATAMYGGLSGLGSLAGGTAAAAPTGEIGSGFTGNVVPASYDGSGLISDTAGDLGGNAFDYSSFTENTIPDYLGNALNPSVAPYGGALTPTGYMTNLADSGGSLIPSSGAGSLWDILGNLPPTPPIPPGTQAPAPVQEGPTTPGTGPLGSISTTAGTALSRILSGAATAADWASLLGTAASTGLGIAGADAQRSASNELADKFLAIGAPSRSRYEASMTPGFEPTSIPGFQGAIDTSTQTLLRQLSAQGGNPYGNPGGLAEVQKYITGSVGLPAIQQYQNQNASTGGYGAFNTAAPGSMTTAANSAGNIYNVLGNGINSLLNPPSPTSTLDDTLAQYRKLLALG